MFILERSCLLNGGRLCLLACEINIFIIPPNFLSYEKSYIELREGESLKIGAILVTYPPFDSGNLLGWLAKYDIWNQNTTTSIFDKVENILKFHTICKLIKIVNMCIAKNSEILFRYMNHYTLMNSWSLIFSICKYMAKFLLKYLEISTHLCKSNTLKVIH